MALVPGVIGSFTQAQSHAGTIRNIVNPWRTKYLTASFRGEMFHVESDSRASGRRTVLHEYPKRDDPYAEDMGRAARRFQVAGYLIASPKIPNYLEYKDRLIAALEKDGPGPLWLPHPYLGAKIDVMVNSYTVTETREKGGFCTFEMDFVEYGTPGFGSAIVYTPAAVNQAGNAVENNAASNMSGADWQRLYFPNIPPSN